MAKKRLFAMSLSYKAIDIYRRLTDLDREIRTEYSDFVRKFLFTKHYVLAATPFLTRYFTRRFLGLSR